MGRLIGLGGRLGSGKDVVADHLVENHGFVKMGMSDALHEAALKLNPIVHVDKLGDSYGVSYFTYEEATDAFGYVASKADFPEYRRFLQVLGTEVGREMFGENVWVDLMQRKIESFPDETQIVVTGLRFPNEVRLFTRLSGETWWIARRQADVIDAALHASENSVSAEDFDLTLLNYGTIEDLHRLVDATLKGD